MSAALSLAQPAVKLPAFQVHQAVYRLGKKLRLKMNAYTLLGLFVHRIRNENGLLDLFEVRWDSRSSWCQYAGISCDEAGKKQITAGFSDLKTQGLIEFWTDASGRTFRRLTRKAIDLVRSLLVVDTPRLVRKEEPEQKDLPGSEEGGQVTVPGSEEPDSLGLLPGQNSPTWIEEPELNKELKKENLNTPPAPQEVEDKVSVSPPPKSKKLMTFKGLVGLVRTFHCEYTSLATVEGYVKELFRAGYETQHIVRATELRLESFDGGEPRYWKRDPRVLGAWKDLCSKARAES